MIKGQTIIVHPFTGRHDKEQGVTLVLKGVESQVVMSLDTRDVIGLRDALVNATEHRITTVISGKQTV